MRQFIEGADWAWAKLKDRACNQCIRFKNQEMPPGCVPPHAHVGFEIDPQSKIALLFVQTGISYTGTNSELSEWFRNGEKRFDDFEQLRAWIKKPLAEAFNAR